MVIFTRKSCLYGSNIDEDIKSLFITNEEHSGVLISHISVKLSRSSSPSISFLLAPALSVILPLILTVNDDREGGPSGGWGHG